MRTHYPQLSIVVKHGATVGQQRRLSILSSMLSYNLRIMPASPWRTFGSPDPSGDFVALLSYLPLKSYWRVFPFFVYTAQVMKQLAAAQGLLGYSLLARPLSKRFWTLSAWKNEDALRAFVQHPPHQRIMTALSPHMDKTEFVRWAVKGADLPLHWDDALRRLPL